MLRTFFSILICLLIGLISGCGNNNSQDTGNGFVDFEEEGYTYLLTEQEAMDIAMTGMDKAVYTATSTIVGPMEYQGENITSYEVTVNGGDHLYLRYVNANTGELMEDMDVRHEISQEEADSGFERVPVSYYTSCPAGWPLCIRTPSSIGFYSQNDPSWACQYLGTSTYYTLGGSSYGATCSHAMHSAGCLVSAYAMELCYNGRGCNSPSVLNARKSCFSGALVSGSCIASAYGARYTTIGVSSVWSYLAAGIPVVAYGYSTCMGSNHAQMLWGHDGSRYWTKDPWYDWTNQDQSMCVSSPSYRVLR